MKLRFFNNFFNYSIYSLAILLAFLLVFERFLEFPVLVSWLGHWHPLVLHFPIVLIFITVIQYWRVDENLPWYLAATTLLTLVSAITGFILSMEGGSKGNLILTHQWMGVVVSFLMVVWYFLQQSISKPQIKILQGVLVLLIVMTGHFGGMVTHGQDFLAFGSNESKTISMPDDPNIYQHIVQPVLDRKCVSCHNENKAKGELILVDFNFISKGGKTGSILDEGNGIMHRINLPQDHEDRMPPADEKQLEEDEFTILKAWLNHGAPNELKYSDLDEGSDLHELVTKLVNESKSNLWMDLPDISNEDIIDFASDYCTIRRMYNGSSALQVLIFPHKTFNSKELEQLKPISENIVDLNLSNLPLTDKDFHFINSLKNLELLDISGSAISDEYLATLDNLNKLKTLKIYNTQIGDASVNMLASIPTLSNLYIFQTNITESGIQEMKNENSALSVIQNSKEALDFKSILPAPMLEPEKYFFKKPYYVKLNHPLENIDIKYSIDGTDPDETSSTINDSLYVDKNFTLKYYATKEGWESSPMDSILFLKSALEPSKYELTYPPDQKYLGVGKSLLFDLDKGSGNYGDDAWMAYKENPFSLSCEFEDETVVSEVILSSIVNTDPYIFPPAKISVYGGKSLSDLNLLSVYAPKELKERSEQHFEFYQIDFNPVQIKNIKIVVTPLQRIPIWHRGKGEKGWFFVDEVVLSSGKI